MRRIFDVNFFGALYTSREAAKHMIPTGGGSIVLISSMSADVSSLSLELNRSLNINSVLDCQYTAASSSI